jgi:hypothetical protein
MTGRIALAVALVIGGSRLTSAQLPSTLPDPVTLSAAALGLSTVTVTIAAPIYLKATTDREPLRLAKAGSILRLLDRGPEWCHVEFEDPQYGRRVGYIETQFVRSAVEPIDVSIADRAPSATSPAAEPPQLRPGLPPPRPPRVWPRGVGERSRAAGFFLGSAWSQASVTTEDGDGSSGHGAAVVLGYGFNPDYAFYTEFTAVSLPGSTTLAHADLGLRVHFLAPASRAVPFVQFALSGRALSDGSVTVSGAGVTLGGGANLHVSPAVAVSWALDWTAGTFSAVAVNTRRLVVAGPPVRATSIRVSVGLVFFPFPPRTS